MSANGLAVGKCPIEVCKRRLFEEIMEVTTMKKLMVAAAVAACALQLPAIVQSANIVG